LVLSSTDVDASTGVARPGTPFTTVVPPGSSTFTVSAKESRRSASNDWSTAPASTCCASSEPTTAWSEVNPVWRSLRSSVPVVS